MEAVPVVVVQPAHEGAGAVFGAGVGFRVRSALAMAIHTFFQEQGFVYVHTPEITGADAEGAGETFTVTTREDGKYEEDFFGKHASLTVSVQLQAEAFELAF